MSLMDLLPDYYIGSTQVTELQGVYETWTDAMKAAKEDLFSQLNVETATWGLSMWESSLGLETDISRPYEYRRTRIMSKLRGQGTTTKAMIQNVSESFSRGKVEIVEYPAEYRFDVRFKDILGIPPNIEDLAEAIEEIKPVHLAYSFIYLYRLHSELFPYTHEQLHSFSHSTLRSGTID